MTSWLGEDAEQNAPAERSLACDGRAMVRSLEPRPCSRFVVEHEMYCVVTVRYRQTEFQVLVPLRGEGLQSSREMAARFVRFSEPATSRGDDKLLGVSHEV